MLGFLFICMMVVVVVVFVVMLVLVVEYLIGKQQIQGGMEIGVVYLQLIMMDLEGMMCKVLDFDIYFEVDIYVVKNNLIGFVEGDWMLYLQVMYKLMKQGDMKWKVEGDLMGMVVSDGLYYGDNVKFVGFGKYYLMMVVKLLMQLGYMVFGCYVDKEMGVGLWFKFIMFEYDFLFVGIGKKGGY